MELRDLESYGEPGAVVYLADRVELMRLMPEGGCVDAVFADPPYRLSTGRGVTVKSGRLAVGAEQAPTLGPGWNVRWLKEARRVLKPGGSLWATGTRTT